MKNLILTKKLYLLVLLLFVNVFASNASVILNGFTIYDNFLKSGKLSVTNPSNSTPFKFRVSLTRQVSGGVYADGSCTITLVYKPDVNSSAETVISTAKNVTNSDYKNSVFANVDNIDATLPANISYGVVLVKWTYYNTNQQKTVTEYETRYVVTVAYTLPSKVPVYMWASATSDYRLGMSEPAISSEWSNRGIFYYAYNQQIPGTVPIYEFEGHVNDANGEPEFPDKVTYYSTSVQGPTEVLPGLGSAWTTVTPKVLFYAFPTQVAGTVPVYCYSNDAGNNFLFIATGEVADVLHQTHIAFYVYPVQLP